MIRDFLHKHLMTLALWLAPSDVKPFIERTLMIPFMIADQVRDGGKGGIVIMGWFHTPEGRELAIRQQEACGELASQIRKEFEHAHREG